MDRKLKRWEAALLFGLLVSLVCGLYLEGERRELSEEVVRLHILANSDTAEDQALKLLVRDRVLELSRELCAGAESREEALERLCQGLPRLRACAQETLREAGSSLEARAELERCHFPSKEYGDFALPAGEYTAVRVVLGEGAGQNWWCVAFPPLCLGAASESVEQAAALGQLREEDAALMTRDGAGYVLKFKALEWWDKLQASVSAAK